MKRVNKYQHHYDGTTFKKFKIASLSAAITTLICASTVQASDIEIYTASNSTAAGAVIVMMLDTSGSMDVGAVGKSACDLTDNEDDKYLGIKENLLDPNGRGFRVNYCELGTEKTYYYRSSKTAGSWRKCHNTESTGSTSRNNCDKTMSGTPNVTGYTQETTNDYIYYFKPRIVEEIKLDRISRLKEALYTLAMMPVFDKNNPDAGGIKEGVYIGIGTYPYIDSVTNYRGRIRIPVADWGPVGSAQRQLVLDLINGTFRGTGGTPTSSAYAEAAAYLLGTTTAGSSNNSYSGSNLAPSSIYSGGKYTSPITECTGDGIFFLTDGQPQSPPNTNTSTLMARALKLSSYDFDSGFPNNTGANDNNNYKSDWRAIGSFSKELFKSSNILHTTGIEKNKGIATAVVGFGSAFTNAATTTDPDARNAYLWGLHTSEGGTFGQGGFTEATQSDDVVASLNRFIEDRLGTIPSISTGSSTIPTDALNPEIIQPYSYFPQFEPKVGDSNLQQVWYGNLKKYYAVNNSTYANKAGTAANQVVSLNKLRDLRDIWAAGNTIEYDNDAAIYQKYGALGQIKYGLTTVDNQTKPERKLLTDYAFNNGTVSTDLDLVHITPTYTTAAATKTDDADRVRSLMALLGYKINATEETNGLDLTSRAVVPELRQMGSILHSLPVLITQGGTMEVKKDTANNTYYADADDREDYVLFGTTQGLLHVVDAQSGKEKFSFLPKEMIEKQSEGFKEGAGNTQGGRDALYYGMDGEWAAHTVYVSDATGKLSVKGVVRSGLDNGDDENLSGKQWIYGGMRMGGRSYYALDLTDIDSPKVKFHIDPTTSKVYSQAHPDGKTFAPLANMAQSWSKPKLDYVNWKGERKLVMFVGGGYDAGGTNGDGFYDAAGKRTGYGGYEHHDYRQATSNCPTTLDPNELNRRKLEKCSANKHGSGIYMFDADSGDLLWYADSGEGSTTIEHKQHTDLKFSVASEIKTVDRNNDGIVDHVYFGDLAGQAFRVDFKNDGATSFTTQVNKILNLHKTDGTSPRFYMPAVFTAHHSEGRRAASGRNTEGGNIVIATFTSGNKSSPVLATTDSPFATGKTNSAGLSFDGVYAIYEYDIHPTGSFFPTTVSAAKTLASSATEAVNKNKLKLIVETTNTTNSPKGAVVNKDTGWGGWYYRFDRTYAKARIDALTADANASVIKGITPLIAMEGNLYVTMYDASATGTVSTCGAGVKGDSFTKRLCLPTGVCPEDAKYTYHLGSGIVTPDVGPSSSSGGGGKQLYVTDRSTICQGDNCKPCEGTECNGKPDFISAGGSLTLISNRWYERFAKAGE